VDDWKNVIFENLQSVLSMRKFLAMTLLSLFTLAMFGQIVEGDDGLYYDENGDLFSGAYKEYYESGNIKTEMSIKKGQKHGTTVLYFYNGQANEVRNYKSNQMHGTWETFNETGTRTAEANYKKGKKHGKWLIWDENGNLRYDMTYKSGERTGIWYIFDASGKVVSSKDYR
jgi:antitoxin component YwqK of YwqJK toxin-antitoxin module